MPANPTNPRGIAAYKKNLGNDAVTPPKLSESMRKYTRCSFQNAGNFWPLAGYGTPSGTAQTINYGSFPADIGGTLPIAYAALGAGQTIVAPTFSSAGVNWALDQTNNEGVEVVYGGNTARGKHAYTVGSGPEGTNGFFAKLTMNIGTVIGTDTWLFGFRINQALAAAYTDYTDYATFAILTAADPALIQTKTRLNTGTAVTVSTTQTVADGVAVTFEIQVNKAGRVKFLLNGANPTALGANIAFTFDAGDVVYPFRHFLNDTGLMATNPDTFFESGYLPERNQS